MKIVVDFSYVYEEKDPAGESLGKDNLDIIIKDAEFASSAEEATRRNEQLQSNSYSF